MATGQVLLSRPNCFKCKKGCENFFDSNFVTKGVILKDFCKFKIFVKSKHILNQLIIYFYKFIHLLCKLTFRSPCRYY